MVPAMMLARYHTVKNEHHFKELLNKYEYCVVCFAPSQADQALKLSFDAKQDIEQNFKNLQNRMQAAAKRDDFKDFLAKDVGFLLVDMASKQADNLADAYGISKFPTCLVFDSDFAVKKSTIKAPESALALIKMLQTQFGKEITELIIKRKKERNLRTQKQIANYYQYGSYNNNWIPGAVWPYSRWGSGPYGVSYDMVGLEN